MKRFAGLTLTAILLSSLSLVAGEKGKWTGWLSDSKCAANGAKAGCPISRLLKAEITLEATVEG